MLKVVLIAVLLVGGVGLIAAVLLSVASTVFAVPVNEKEVAIRDVLPGANCGACGYSGCDSYAKALANEGNIPANLCRIQPNPSFFHKGGLFCTVSERWWNILFYWLNTIDVLAGLCYTIIKQTSEKGSKRHGKSKNVLPFHHRQRAVFTAQSPGQGSVLRPGHGGG